MKLSRVFVFVSIKFYSNRSATYPGHVQSHQIPSYLIHSHQHLLRVPITLLFLSIFQKNNNKVTENKNRIQVREKHQYIEKDTYQVQITHEFIQICSFYYTLQYYNFTFCVVFTLVFVKKQFEIVLCFLMRNVLTFKLT